ncbi:MULTISPECIES: DUF2283 domain-containing protein [Bacteria]|uniref:DUF2283 domain-containing protein n=1 Tax=Bacteria TaxID=2 RepID=UPI003C7C4E2A
MTIRYDPEADAAYVPVGPEPAAGESADQVVGLANPQGRGEIILDFDKDGASDRRRSPGRVGPSRPQALSEAVAEDGGGGFGLRRFEPCLGGQRCPLPSRLAASRLAAGEGEDAPGMRVICSRQGRGSA